MTTRALTAALVLSVILTACSGVPPAEERIDSGPSEVTSEVARRALLSTDGDPLINPAEIVDAAGYDAIPAINDPVIVDAGRAGARLEDTEQVMLVVLDGQARAYPVRSLIRHEIVNDILGGTPVAVTWCPLCNTGITFDRRVDGNVEVFGVSGALYRSALVMFDRRTQSLWPQPLGLAALGPQLGATLTVLASDLLPWAEVRTAYPDVTVALGSEAELDEVTNPYDGYDMSDDPFLFSGEPDPRLPAFTRVAGVTVGAVSRAWSFELLSRQRVVEATVSGQPLVVLWAPGAVSPLETSDVRVGRDVGSTGVYDPRVEGRALTFSPAGPTGFRDRETGSTWTVVGLAVAGPLAGTRLIAVPHQDAFWFAWAAFQPETELYS